MLYVFYPIERPSNVECTKLYRNFNTPALPNILSAAASIPWCHIFQTLNINQKVETLTQELLKIWNEFAPLKVLKPKHFRPPWINIDIINKIKARSSAHKQWNKNKTRSNWEKFSNLKKQVKQMVRKSLRKFLHNEIECKNICGKVLWQNLKKYGLVKDKLMNNKLVIGENQLLDKFVINEIQLVHLFHLIYCIIKHHLHLNLIHFIFKIYLLKSFGMLFLQLNQMLLGMTVYV